jgi:pimeloyl-ACP methyl ester carboxylesterase
MEQNIEIADYKIFAKIEGEGSPLLMLHSYWGSQQLFDRMANLLSGTRKVIRIDLPGHGNSGNPPANYSFESFAVVLNELLIRLNIHEKVSIIGHSMGGYAALAFAATYSEKITSLLLIHSPVRAADIKSIKLRERESRLLSNGKKELLLQATIPSNFAPENLNKMDWALTLLNQTSLQVTTEGAVLTIQAMNQRRNYLPILQQASYPVLIIIGKYDNVYNADDQLHDAGQIPNAEVLFLDHSGHLGFMEEEELVLTRLSEFITNTPYSP